MTKTNKKNRDIFITALLVLLSIAVFLFAVDLMGEAFKHLGKNAAQSLIFATTNPFIGLFIGLLITAIIQSSSTSTSMVVAMVAAGSITIADAVPMIMGANIGTTLTSTIVSLGFITKKNEFRKAIAGGTVHDFFNILTVLILFPLEFYYGLVSSSAQKITEFLIPSHNQGGVGDFGFDLFDVIPLTNFLIKLINNSVISIILSFILLFGSIKVLSRVIYKMVIGESQEKLREFIFSNPYKSFTWGTILTAAVQSSSITTSLAVPFVATGKIKLQSATPFIMGANIGTTITAFIAVLIESSMAMSIAVTHLLFNLVGVMVFLPFRQLRNIPIVLAYKFGALTMNYRLAGITYILFTFFIIPFALIYFNKNASVIKELTYTLSSEVGTSQRKVLNVVTPDRRYGTPWGNNTSAANSGDIFNIYRRNDVLFINSKIYLFKQKGFCWDDEEPLGKYSMCVEEIIPQWTNGHFSFDSVYIFKKSYYEPVDQDSSYFRYFISIDDKMLVKTEKLSYQHEIEFIEELTGIQDQ